ncbi:PAS domain-containing protein [Candidatus Kaiserbacteria bacterium]|nr:PAS domain-containing protein [Candidatus Kaiserbacteria bacterium]
MENIPRQWLEAIAQNAATAVIILDKQRIIRYANDAAVRMAERSGKSNSDLIGTCYDDILKLSVVRNEKGDRADPASFPTHLALEQGIETNQKLFEQVYALRHYWLSISCIPLFNEHGAVEYAVAYFRDISEEKLHADQLAFLVASSKITSVQSDAEILLMENVRLITPSLADWCAIDVINPMGQFIRLPVAGANEPHAVSGPIDGISWEPENTTCMGTVLTSGTSELYSVLRQKEKFREVVPQQCLHLVHGLEASSLIVIPIKMRGNIVGALSLAYTTSGRHYTQEDLVFMEDFCHHLGLIIENVRLYHELEKAGQEKDVFLAALSHELRNPLAPIKSSIELLKMKQSEKESIEELSIIEHQFDHITKLVNDLLDASRYSFGKIHLDHERISLNEVIKQVIMSNQGLLDKQRLHLDVSLPPEDIMLYADWTRIEQALTNILHNAEKFTPEGGSIVINAHKEGENAVITIADTGIGIEAGEAARIFDGSLRMRQSKYPSRGLGIGLLLVREIVQLHGGRIEAASEGLGKGSTFTITLPLTQGGKTHRA